MMMDLVIDMLSYFVVADLLLALHLDAAAVPSTLTVSVEQCSNIWDRLLAIYQRRGLCSPSVFVRSLTNTYHRLLCESIS